MRSFKLWIKVSTPFLPTVMNGSSEALSLQRKQVVLDVIDILHAQLKYYLSILYLTIKNVDMLS